MRANSAQLNHLLACLNHRSPDLISAREQDTVTIFASCAPSPDRNLEIGKPGPQPLAEVACLGQSAGRYGCDTNHSRILLANQGDNLGCKRLVGHNFDFIFGGIKQLPEHEECQFVRFVVGRTSQDGNFRKDNQGALDDRRRL